MVSRFQRWFSKRRIAVLMGGTSPERKISLLTGRAILASLKRQGFQAVAIDPKHDVTTALKRARIDFAYIALHGPGGEDGTVQGLLEWLGIAYTGSGVLGSALAMDKVSSKRMFDAAGVRSAPWAVVTRGDTFRILELKKRFHLPAVVKPSRQGSAIGVSIVRKAGEWDRAFTTAFRYDREALVEAFLDGPEITVGVLGEQILPIIEIVPNDRTFYDFHAKYAAGGSRHLLPARISVAAAKESRRLALTACKALHIDAVGRVDLIVDKRRGPCVLEVNTIPGMTETSLLPEAARAVGLNFDALVLRIAELSYATAR